MGLCIIFLLRKPDRVRPKLGMTSPVHGNLLSISRSIDGTTEILIETIPFIHTMTFRMIDDSLSILSKDEILYKSGIKVAHKSILYEHFDSNPQSDNAYGYALWFCKTRITLPNGININPDLSEGMTMIDGETIIAKLAD
jgi:hypothetical protein